MPSRFKKGLSLGAVLALLAACSAFIFIIGALGIFNLRLEGAAADKEQARNLAESAVQMGIAKLLEEELQAKGVAVVVEASHSCMAIRGIRKPQSMCVTSAMKGLFRSNLSSRSEVMTLIYGKSHA